LAYTDDQFFRDIFKQLKGKQLPPAFCLEFEHAEVKWLMNCKNYSLESLMNEAPLYYINLKSYGGWKVETNKHQQIIALTTQINEMNDKLSKLIAKAGDTPVVKIPGNSHESKGKFSLWRLKKVSNSKEHCMIERNGAKWYWCEDGHSFENKPCGMYCMHKPGDGHVAWLARKEKFKKDNATKKGNTTPALSATLPLPVPTPARAKSNIGKSLKLSLSKSLQSALMTKMGISESRFKQIWDEAYSSLGN
jgi:hypothetical protein